jgi:hypothetical protein
MPICWLVLLLLALGTGFGKMLGAEGPTAPGPELKYEEPRCLTGLVYGLGPESKTVLFKFKRVSNRSGSTLNVRREFTYPDGKPAAREKVVYEGDWLVSYDLEDLQTGEAGSVRLPPPADASAKSSVEFEYRKPASGGTLKARTETLVENTLINDMVGPFLVAHWDALLRGEKVKCRYIVVSRSETVGFTFVKDSESVWEGREVLVVKMEATSAFVARLVDPLIFTIEKAQPHRVFRYVGRTTPKLQVKGKWKDLDAATVFDWEPAR